MDIMKMGADVLGGKLGNSDSNSIQAAIGNLMSNNDGKLDIGGLVAGLQSKGLGDVATSWLGDGENAAISTDQVKSLFGGDKIQAMAAQLGADEGSVLDGLKDAIPQMVDKSSSGGSLFDSVGGVGGLAGMAKKFFS